MNWRILAVVGLAAALAVPATALASHNGTYTIYPTERDDQGRVLEPDPGTGGWGHNTSVLGPPLNNRVLDLPDALGNFNANAAGGARADDPPYPPTNPLANDTNAREFYAANKNPVVAPGCTRTGSDGLPERERSGMCGLWTVGVRAWVGAGIAGEKGFRPGLPEAPGAFTPTKTSLVRLLDGQITWGTPVLGTFRYADLNAKLADNNIAPRDKIYPGATYVWAWYGEWKDLNGNGVIDRRGSMPGPDGEARNDNPRPAPDLNEWVYFGSCLDFGGTRRQSMIDLGLCREDPNPFRNGHFCGPGNQSSCANTTIHLFFFPGNRHTAEVSDFPGQQVVNWVQREFDCITPPTCDEIARDSFFGDPLLDNQAEVTPDDTLHDRTGDPDFTVTHWDGGGGNAWYPWSHFDYGLLSTSVEVYAVNCEPGGANRVKLTTCMFTDVDRHTTLSTAAEQLLVGGDPETAKGSGGLKGTLRTEWVKVRDGDGFKVGRTEDGILDGKDARSSERTTGLVDDRAFNPGFSREPNHPLDDYVGVQYATCGPGWPIPLGEAQHRGYCNVVDTTDPGTAGLTRAYQAYEENPRAHNDVLIAAINPVLFPVTVTPVSPSCLQCLWGAGGVGPTLPTWKDPRTSADNHQRVLYPGRAYILFGQLGVWQDKAHQLDETTLLVNQASCQASGGNWTTTENGPNRCIQTYPPDGWIGWLARENGHWRYRGYADFTADCRTEKGPATNANPISFAECEPYNFGTNSNPQEYALEDQPRGEWQGRCGASDIVLTGTLTSTRLIVWRAWGQGVNEAGTVGPIEEYGPGATPMPASGILLPVTCDPLDVGQGGSWQNNDLLIILDMGPGSDTFVTTKVDSVPVGDVTGDGKPDVDVIRDVDEYKVGV